MKEGERGDRKSEKGGRGSSERKGKGAVSYVAASAAARHDCRRQDGQKSWYVRGGQKRARGARL
jgi:hypothetical protein